jgi:HlyD family secretion protein
VRLALRAIRVLAAPAPPCADKVPIMKHSLAAAAVCAAMAAAGWTAALQPPEPGASASSSRSTWESIARRFGGSACDTKASRDSTMAFTVPAQVKEILVQGGQRVKEGDVLIRARDSDQAAIVEGQRISAANENETKAAELALENARIRFERLQALGEDQRSPQEFDEARIAHETAKVQVEQAKVRHELEKIRLKQAEGQFERYRLEAPFDGIVEEVKVEVGQGVRETDPAIRVVNIETLRLDVWAPTHETISLGIDAGAKAWVLIDLPGKPWLADGVVQNISPVADSVSQTRRVRVDVANTAGWPAGTKAVIRFTDPGAEWAEYREPAAGGKAADAAPTQGSQR